MILTPFQNPLLSSFQWKKISLDCPISVLNKYLTVPLEVVLSNELLLQFLSVRLQLTGLGRWKTNMILYSKTIPYFNWAIKALSCSFFVLSLEQVMTQISGMALVSIPMRRILKAWSTEAACIRQLTQMPFKVGCITLRRHLKIYQRCHRWKGSSMASIFSKCRAPQGCTYFVARQQRMLFMKGQPQS